MSRTSHSTVGGRSGTAGRSPHDHALPRRPGGFTLVELTVVILVILLLIGMLLPTVSRVRIQALATASRADVAIIERACELYYDDNKKEYPRSEPGADMPGATGGQRLVRYLVASGRPYGCEHVPTIQQQGDQRSFSDRFGNAILYYRFDRAQGKYHNDHNPQDNDGFLGPADADLYAKFYNRAVSGLQYRRSDFLLISPGRDGKFVDPKGEDAMNPADDVLTDDITNFFSE